MVCVQSILWWNDFFSTESYLALLTMASATKRLHRNPDVNVHFRVEETMRGTRLPRNSSSSERYRRVQLYQIISFVFKWTFLQWCVWDLFQDDHTPTRRTQGLTEWIDEDRNDDTMAITVTRYKTLKPPKAIKLPYSVFIYNTPPTCIVQQKEIQPMFCFIIIIWHIYQPIQH